ncbi:DNA-binding transcriptional regulator, AcrR family [Thermomonospora echinospora]|uniref:DNA-binding transcriptional regulator, AcrR family n=1 Tax=Thermomonospora echinospora TaxID=1992 RepID=A0A1H6DZ89_9ACTN|nr:TetR family transcriptional regulator C-terminal domain-containing protein [Thermomonospora echinospora]SEG90133.1 DNA-binding transcriptional regulator, AcrR family [Thermomonospora echinospora]
MPRPSVEAERREQILRAACEVISEKGYKALRVTDVARHAKLSTGSVHYYFETKRDLVHAAFEWNFSRSLERRKSILDRHPNARDRLHAFVDSYLPRDDETAAAWRVWAETWVEALHDPDLRKLNERIYGEWRGIIAEIIRLGQAEGLITPGDPVLLANVLVSMIDGLAIQALVGSKHMTIGRMRSVCDHLLETMSAEPVQAAIG